MHFSLSSNSPLAPVVAFCFVLSGLGVLFVILSDNAALKRRVFPVTLVLFYSMAFLVVWGSGRLGGGALATAGVIAALVASALLTYAQIVFCVDCGVTMRRPGDGEVRCPNCIAKRRTIQ